MRILESQNNHVLIDASSVLSWIKLWIRSQVNEHSFKMSYESPKEYVLQEIKNFKKIWNEINAGVLQAADAAAEYEYKPRHYDWFDNMRWQTKEEWDRAHRTITGRPTHAGRFHSQAKRELHSQSHCLLFL
jgi:hypothetical protein